MQLPQADGGERHEQHVGTGTDQQRTQVTPVAGRGGGPYGEDHQHGGEHQYAANDDEHLRGGHGRWPGEAGTRQRW